MSKIIIVIGLLVTALILFGLFVVVFPDPINSERYLEIDDISMPHRIILKPNKNQGGIHSLSLELNGKSDGKIKIIKAHSNTSFDIVDTVQNKIELNYSGDWYTDSCLLFFENINAKKGAIEIKYRFYGSNNL